MSAGVGPAADGGRGGSERSATAGAGVAAGVGAGIERPERFGPVAAWAWMWRSFDMELPDVTGAAWRAEPGTEAATARTAEAAGYARYAAHGPW
ncbi:hypothetical protein [Streptomyces omiyaensis]|uniref:Uncharacterized protein n=1 Tax=Streptomyces omiyaensis TaxID=68247 RepID=A0ABW7C3P0_9ACTN|nr:hypothetical protein [Streptomyces omiyaensis]GGY83627.1 hypothetical protein GCM10010363_75180 [Streptomyces omiyaensis]